MLSLQQIDSGNDRPWQLLFIYNVYRIFCLLFFLAFFLITQPIVTVSGLFYFLLWLSYLIMALLFFYRCKKRSPAFNQQVFVAGTLDIIFVVLLISFIGDMQSGFIILLNVIVAALSILLPGRYAIFFAAIASFILLTISFIEYFYGRSSHLSTFYSSGIYGASLFATALTAWYLAHRIKISENIAWLQSCELASMQRMNEYIIERLHSGVIYVDLNRHIQLMNTAAKHFFHLPSDYVYSSLSQLSTVLDDKCQQFMDNIQQHSRPSQIILETPFLRVYFFSAAIDSQAATLIFLDDMSAVAQQVQQLKLASLGRLSASIAHELRNPLGAISHAVQLLGDTTGLDEENLRLKYLIIKNCNRMNSVIKNVLQLSRQEKSKPELIEFFPFITHFKHDFCVYNQCNIIIDPSVNATTRFMFDKSQLEQILVILFDNAMRHGRDKADTVTIMISIKASLSSVEIMIQDTGPGIPEHLQHDIFEPFFSTLSSGFGMGLFIAKDLCEVNQAQLIAVPTKKNACFILVINLVDEIFL